MGLFRVHDVCGTRLDPIRQPYLRAWPECGGSFDGRRRHPRFEMTSLVLFTRDVLPVLVPLKHPHGADEQRVTAECEGHWRSFAEARDPRGSRGRGAGQRLCPSRRRPSAAPTVAPTRFLLLQGQGQDFSRRLPVLRVERDGHLELDRPTLFEYRVPSRGRPEGQGELPSARRHDPPALDQIF